MNIPHHFDKTKRHAIMMTRAKRARVAEEAARSDADAQIIESIRKHDIDAIVARLEHGYIPSQQHLVISIISNAQKIFDVLMMNECPIDEFCIRVAISYNRKHMFDAILLALTTQSKQRIVLSPYCIWEAIACVRERMCLALIEYGCAPNLRCAHVAIERGNRPLFELVVTHLFHAGVELDAQCLINAICGGHDDIFLRLIELGCSSDEYCITVAIKRNRDQMLKRLIEEKCPMSAECVRFAISHKKHEQALLLIANDCPLDNSCLREAIEYNHDEIFDELMKRNCPMDESCLRAARRYNCERMVEVLLAAGCPE